MAAKLRNLWDGLTNVFTGLGSTSDARLANLYAFTALTAPQIEAAYRGSGMMRKVIDIPAFDKVREWRDWKADDEQIKLLEAEERRLGLRQKVMLAEIFRGLGGGAIILGMKAGDAEMPLNERGAGKGSLAYIHVISRFALTAQEWVDDPTDPLHGGPKFWTVQSGASPKRIHPSRVIAFPADPVPDLNGSDPETRFWGESRVQRVLEAVQNSDTAQGAFANLITKARNTIIGIPGLSDLAATDAGNQRLRGRIAAMMLGESMFNATLRDAGDGTAGAGETIDHRQVNWAGIPEIMYAFAAFVAAVSDIPVTRLLGKAAEGMNSSGDSQQRDWDKMVKAEQTLKLAPCIDRIDAALIPSALGSRPPELWWEFAPLGMPTEAEEATRFKTTMEAMKLASDMAFVPDEAFAKAGQNTIVEGGWMPGLDAALAEIPEDERYGVQPEIDPNAPDPSALQAANENTVAAMKAKGAITGDQALALLADAAPRSLYVRRDVVNVDDLKEWAKDERLPELQDGLHVTIIYSPQAIDWIKAGNSYEWGDQAKDGKLTLAPGGPRVVEPLGDRTAVLMFASSELYWRHKSIIEAGASHGYDDYQPHISLTGEPVDLSNVKPYRGRIVLGPEIFEEIK